jgi:hypothetical protein
VDLCLFLVVSINDNRHTPSLHACAMGLYTYGSHEFEQSLQAKSGDPPDLRCELEQELRAEICCIRDELLYIYSMELEFLIAGQDRLYAAAFQCRGPDNRHRPSAVGPVFSC